MDNRNNEVTGWTGWVMFASFMLMASGIIQFFYGLGAIFSQTWYITGNGTAYVFNTQTWGWMVLILGVLLFISGVLLLSGNVVGRTLAMLFIVLGFLANLALFAVTPVWSTVALILYAVVGYAVLAHGGEMKQLTQ